MDPFEEMSFPEERDLSFEVFPSSGGQKKKKEPQFEKVFIDYTPVSFFIMFFFFSETSLTL